MKQSLAFLLGVLVATSALAHERITLGPNGGRVVYVDSATTPHVEFLVAADGRASITLLDRDRKPITIGEQEITVTAGPRSTAKKLAVEKQGDRFVTEPVPAGAPYTVVIQLRETPSSKPLTLRVHYNNKPGKSGKPAYIDDSINEGSGAAIAVPETLDALFREINEHAAELKEGVEGKKYETVEEATEALTILLQALPAKSGSKAAAMEPKIPALLKELETIAEANASRNLPGAKPAHETFQEGLKELKQHYPEGTSKP